MDSQAANEERATIIVPSRLLEKIDRNRDQMSRAEFVEFCVDALLKQGEGTESLAEGSLRRYKTEGTISREEFEEFKKGIKDLQRAYIDLLLSVTLEPFSKASAERWEHFKQRLTELLEG